MDATKNEGPRWVRLNFVSLVAGMQTIKVVWDNSEANVRYQVKEEDGTSLSSVVRGANPGTWTGTLEADTSYFIGLWSTEGTTNYTASIEVEGDT